MRVSAIKHVISTMLGAPHTFLLIKPFPTTHPTTACKRSYAYQTKSEAWMGGEKGVQGAPASTVQTKGVTQLLTLNVLVRQKEVHKK